MCVGGTDLIEAYRTHNINIHCTLRAQCSDYSLRMLDRRPRHSHSSHHWLSTAYRAILKFLSNASLCGSRVWVGAVHYPRDPSFHTTGADFLLIHLVIERALLSFRCILCEEWPEWPFPIAD